MSFLQEKDKPDVQKILNNMVNPVKLIIFTSEQNCQYCQETKQLLNEVVDLTDNISLTEYDLATDSDAADQYHIDKAPAIVIRADQDYGVRYFGIPSGYEFGSLLEDIVDISRDDAGFSETQLDEIARIEKPLHLQVFVTPTCPYCPAAVRNAHRMAMVNPNITADMIEATEFPELSQQYNVRGVPRTVVNDDFNIDGGLPEDAFIHQIVEHLETQNAASA